MRRIPKFAVFAPSDQATAAAGYPPGDPHKQARTKRSGYLAQALLAAALLTACSSHAGSSTAGDQEPIPECVEYQTLFASCTGRDAGLANAALATVHTSADRARVATLCATNLKRLKDACR